MSDVWHVHIACILGDILSTDAAFIVLPSVAGEIGLYPRHEPFVAKLKPGNIRIHLPDGRIELVYTSGGYAEVSHNVIHVLADIGIRTEAGDKEAALHAQDVVRDATARGIPVGDFARAHAELLSHLSQLTAEHEVHRRRR